MRIAVLGTGVVGRTLAAGFVDHDHEVVVGTRSVDETLARTEPDAQGNPAFAQWLAQQPMVRLATFADAAAEAELVVNASSGLNSLQVLDSAGAEQLSGKVILDVSNPLDFSAGFPPSLNPVNTDSLAEQIQRALPATKVVKSLNTVNAALMTQPRSLASGDHTIFVSGDDSQAKATVTGLLQEFGWSDIVDLGDLTTARGTEMYLALWLRFMGALGTAELNVKLVR